MSSFKDSSLQNGIFLIELIDAIRPGTVNFSLVNKGQTAEEQIMNAKYAISLARKIGCCIFILWEDIVQVNPKMILTFVATLMAHAK